MRAKRGAAMLWLTLAAHRILSSGTVLVVGWSHRKALARGGFSLVAFRRRFQLVPDEEISITVTKESAKKPWVQKDPWAEICGTLSPEEADEMLRAIHESRRSKSEAPELDSP